ncbi:MAG: TlpA family protein disulfide reductase, partial [Nitrospirae bacterium]|nr:TlpA family protein disulfide reductase [Nitrospirota bacterium]
VIYILNVKKPHVINKVGSPAPDFSLKDINGKTITLTSIKGNVIGLEFFATWCPPCRDSIPHLNNLYARYKAKGLLVYGVNLDSNINAETLKKFANENNVQYNILLSDGSVGKFYNINSIPVTYIIDKQLNIIDEYVGFSENLEEIIDKEVEGLL